MNIKSAIIALFCTLASWAVPAMWLSTAPAGVVATAPANAPSKSMLSINQATLEQLVAIPGIGEKKAQAILDYIKAKGPIKDQKQLTEVKGIGDKMATKIAAVVSFG